MHARKRAMPPENRGYNERPSGCGKSLPQPLALITGIKGQTVSTTRTIPVIPGAKVD